MAAKSIYAMTVQELTDEIEALRGTIEDITNSATGDEDLPDDDLAEVEEATARIARLQRALNIKEKINESGSRGRRTDNGSKTRGLTTVPAIPRDPNDVRTHGFNNFGEFAAKVGQAYKRSSEDAITRLTNAATTYGTESIGGDGGWLVPPEFSDSIWKKITGEASLMSRCAPFTTSRNSLAFPKDETSPWENSSGIRVFWEGEGDSGTASKPKFEIETARLNKLMALVKVTDELLEDAPGLDSYLRFWTPIKMTSRINTAIVRGTGVGKPLGIINAASLVTVSKETSQDATTIIFPNINNMWSRLYSECRANAVWLINQQAEPMLNGMAFIPAATQPGGSTTLLTSYTPVYLPSGTVAGSPYGTLFGRPVIPMQPCSALGTIGDIMLVDLMQYMVLTKAQATGPQVDTSIHLHFDQAIDTYRFIFRMTGQPMWANSIDPENGTDTLGWAIALETRS